jgi:dTDP-4-dehydrorhamnose 3,5-epimerase
MDVVVDIRLDSPTYRKWEVFELTEDNRLMVYVPEGVAHGFQTLVDGTEVLYQMSTPYCAESARGLRWDDPTFSIMWPLPPILSPRDASLPFFRP